jgi:hypothetical protein
LEGKIDLTFKNGGHELEIDCIKNIRLPTLENKEEIEKEIREKEELIRTDSNAYQARYGRYYLGSGLTSYSAMDLQTLRARAYQLQLVMHNRGDKHLEDGLVKLTFPVLPGFGIAGHIYLNTYHLSVMTGIDHQDGYPKVQREPNQVIVTHNIGEVRHQVPAEVFGKPLRVIPMEETAGQTIEVMATVYGSNLPRPQDFKLHIKFR